MVAPPASDTIPALHKRPAKGAIADQAVADLP
jgi:hypothetical protein